MSPFLLIGKLFYHMKNPLIDVWQKRVIHLSELFDLWEKIRNQTVGWMTMTLQKWGKGGESDYLDYQSIL